MTLTRRFAAFYFLLYLPVGLQAPYLFLFFQRQGFTNTQLGTLAAVGPLVNLFMPPVWGVITDALGDRRRMLALLLVGCALTYPWFISSSRFETTLLIVVLFSALNSSGSPLTDTIVLENLSKAGGDYGRLRMWGSIGYTVPLLVLWFVLPRGAHGPASSLYPLFIGYAVSRLVSAAWVRALPASRGHGGPWLDFHGARIFLRPRFLALALCGLLSSGAMSAYYLYFAIYLDTVGIADNLKGCFWVFAVVSEIGMMLIIGRVMRRIGVKWTLALGPLGGALRLFTFSFPLAAWAIAATQLLHALTLTAFTVAGVTFLTRLVPSKLRATGQTLWASVTMGMGSALGAALSGRAVAAWGLLPMYRAFSLVALAALLVAVFLVREPAEGAVPQAASEA